jgi:predicted RNA-binding Zn-ribbon protein involved in translation (DUF1610 family)
MIRRLLCKFWYGKHQRGRLVSHDQTHKTFACPRCGRTTIYPIAKA